MITQYVDAVYRSLQWALDLLARLALPAAILLGLAAVAAAVCYSLQRENGWLRGLDWRRSTLRGLGYAGAALLVIAGWAGLRTIHPLARRAVQRREAAEATTNPVPDAPAVFQYGPAVAALSERTYTRTLRLPPEFLQRVADQGVGVLSPYLADPSTEN